ncbi:MAG: site-2 protease family protein [Candidatus Daviesbacteria bacterium]|nr:MAG: site-2 protease family protein [Candidatus Daviesbacteria bacterium]
MNPEFLAFSLVILLFSVILHEVMHGWVALQFGDSTAQRMGRLTLNPIPHIDPIGTVLLPTLLIISGSPFLLGWAKPVPVNPLNFSNLRKGELFVSAAGIAANFALAAGAATTYHILNILPQTFPALLAELLKFTVTINLVLGVFNFFPIPPLDGSKILLSQLPYNLARTFGRLEQQGFIILILLLVTGIPQLILGFVVSTLLKLLGL